MPKQERIPLAGQTKYDSLTTKQKKAQVKRFEMTVLESILYCIGMVLLIVLFSSI